MATGYTNLNCKLPAAREPCEGHDGLGRDTRMGKVWNLDESLHLFACFLSLVLAIIRMWPRGALLS